ncbi:TraK family protein [Bartonella sp. DGB2]|uniref:TraK family protein n=1 Tax=Bartonella sp. DGB2 TaxID=3388426 RepID=UPI00398FC7BA
MKKSLSQRISALVSSDKSIKTNKNKAIFIAMRNDIKTAMNDGWDIKSIWYTLHKEEKITCSYSSFVKYVNEFIKKDQSMPNKKFNIDGFNFNPKPREDDLL